MTDAADVVFETLAVKIDGRIGHLTLNRPARLNALSPKMLAELAAAATGFDAADDVRVVVIEGAGAAFCAGFDLAGLRPEPGAAAHSTYELADLGRQMADAVERMRAVTVVRLHGHVVGGGLVLAAACDLRVAAENTKFSIPEAEIGIPLAWGGIPRLVRELGPAVTKDLVMTCREFGATEAQALGFVSRVAPEEQLYRETNALANALAQRPAFVLSTTKRHVNAVTDAAYPTAHAFADAGLAVAATNEPEAVEATTRYMAGRKAKPAT